MSLCHAYYAKRVVNGSLSPTRDRITNGCAYQDVLSEREVVMGPSASNDTTDPIYVKCCYGDNCYSKWGSCVGNHCYINASSQGWCVGDSCYVNGSGCCAGSSCYVNGSGYCQGAGCNVNGTLLPIRCCGDAFVAAVQISLRNTTADSSVMNTTK